MSRTTTVASSDREVGRGAGIGQRPSSCPDSSSAGAPMISARREEELLAVGGVPHGRRGDQARPDRTPSASMMRAVAPATRRTCAPSPRAAGDGVASTPWPRRVIVISRARTSPAGPTTSRRVEFVPQSTAASAPASFTPPSITEPARSDLRPDQTQPLRHPRPDHVVPAGQPPGQVGMQALDPLARASHSPARTRPGPVVGNQGVAFGGVTAMAVGQRRRRPPAALPPARRPAASRRPTRTRSSGSTSQ